MLPILRVIPVGGVLLAIAILILALDPPGNLRTSRTGLTPRATGALIAREDHPEWWQLLMLAALRRAGELQRLRELPDAPVKIAPAAPAPQPQKVPEVAAVPKGRDNAEPEDVTGTIVQAPAATIPVDIGETSSTELPVIPHEEHPPVITPERAKLPRQSKAEPPPLPKRTARRALRPSTAAKPQSAAQSSIFEPLVGGGGSAAVDNLRPFTAQ